MPKIHKRLHNVPGRPVISNSGFFTENISAFLEYHLKPLSQKVKSFIKDTNDFLKKLNELRDLPDDFILCTIDVVGLYPNIPHKEGMEAIRKALDKRRKVLLLKKPLVWWRYIDDIFMIWQQGEEALKEFLKIINSCHPTIKFTAE